MWLGRTGRASAAKTPTFWPGASKATVFDEDRGVWPMRQRLGPGHCPSPQTGGGGRGLGTYARGNYDVHCRVAKGGEGFSPTFPVAASLKQEVHASVTYDGANRLWVAWEEGPERWGKDFGSLAQKGASLYGGGRRTIAMKCVAGGQVFQPKANLPELKTTVRLSPSGRGKSRPQRDRASRVEQNAAQGGTYGRA